MITRVSYRSSPDIGQPDNYESQVVSVIVTVFPKALAFASNSWRRQLTTWQCGSGVKSKLTVDPSRRLREHRMFFAHPLMLQDYVAGARVTGFRKVLCK